MLWSRWIQATINHSINAFYQESTQHLQRNRIWLISRKKAANLILTIWESHLLKTWVLILRHNLIRAAVQSYKETRWKWWSKKILAILSRLKDLVRVKKQRTPTCIKLSTNNYSKTRSSNFQQSPVHITTAARIWSHQH